MRIRANDVLAAYDRLVDPFKGSDGGSEVKQSELTGEAGHGAGHGAEGARRERSEEPNPSRRLGDGDFGMGFDQEDAAATSAFKGNQTTQKSDSPKNDTSRNDTSGNGNGSAKNETRQQEPRSDQLSNAAKMVEKATDLASKVESAIKQGLGTVLQKLGIEPKMEKAPEKPLETKHQEQKTAEPKTADPKATHLPGEQKSVILREKVAAMPESNAHAGQPFHSTDQRGTKGGNAGDAPNLARFAQDARAPGAEQQQQAGLPFSSAEIASTFPGAADNREIREQLRKDEVREDGRTLPKDADVKQKRETREAREGREFELRGEETISSQSDGVGAGWMRETHDADELHEPRQGLRLEDVLGENNRCRGLLEDGHRCLRRPVEGTSYCREHASAILSGNPTGVSGTGGTGGPEDVEPLDGVPPDTLPEIDVNSEGDVTDPQAPAFNEGAVMID